MNVKVNAVMSNFENKVIFIKCWNTNLASRETSSHYATCKEIIVKKSAALFFTLLFFCCSQSQNLSVIIISPMFLSPSSLLVHNC